MNNIYLHRVIAPLFLLLFVFVATENKAATSDLASFQMEFQEGVILFEAHNASIKEILDGIDQEFQIVISGLDARHSEITTFSIKSESVKEAIMLFFRHIGEKNVAFEFLDDRLRHVSIVPESQKKGLPQSPIDTPEAPPEDHSTAIEVVEVISGSQAIDLGIERGDLILEYDGKRLNRASELADEAKARSSDEVMEMVVLRNKGRIRFFVNGGFIGIRVRTAKVLKEWVDY